MSTIYFDVRRVLCALMPAVVSFLASCGGNGGDADISAAVSSSPGTTGNRFLASQSAPRQDPINVQVTDSVVGLLTLVHSQAVLAGSDSSIEIHYIVNGLPSPVSSFQIEYADSGLPIEATGCQMLMLQNFFDYGFVCQGDILVHKSNTAIRINLRLQSGRVAYSNNVTLPGS